MGLVPIYSPCAATILNLFDSQVRDVFIASAFLRIDAVSEMLARLLKDRATPCSLRVLTRGNYQDILAGASDIASLALLAKARHSYLTIECRRDPRLHAKIYVVDGSKAIITSANLTPPGLNTNIEFGIFIDSPDVAKNIMDYFEPIWEMAERFDENVLHDLASGAEEENLEAPSEIDRDLPERIIHRRQPPRTKKRSLAKLPKTDMVQLNAGWDQLNELGMDVEPARSTMVSGVLGKKLRRIVRVYDKSKQLDIGSGATISPEEVNLINNVETLKMILASPNWELRDAAAEALGNIFGDQATQALFEALQQENEKFVLWSILISLKPRISEHNLDQVLELLKRTDDIHLRYSVFLIAATLKPQSYGIELIRHIPKIKDSEYIEEAESVLHRLSDGEFIEVINSSKDWADSFKRVSLLLSLAGARGAEVENQVYSVLFPDKPVTEVLFEALQRENDPDVLWSIRTLLKPRISEHNLDQLLELLKGTDDIHLRYSIYLIAATVKPQLYGAELIKQIPNIYDNEYIIEVESALRRLSDGEFIEVISSLKDWADSFKRVSLLLSFAEFRGGEIENQIQSILFPHLQKSATPLTDWMVNSLLQQGLHSEKEWSELIPDPRKRSRAELEKRIWTNSKTPSEK